MFSKIVYVRIIELEKKLLYDFSSSDMYVLGKMQGMKNMLHLLSCYEFKIYKALGIEESKYKEYLNKDSFKEYLKRAKGRK